MGKTLLLLSGTHAAIAQALREKGHALAVMDADPQAPAFAFADSCLIADVWQASDCAAAAERYNRKIRKLDGVLLAADAPLTAASISQRLHLPGLPLHVAELAHDRLMTKRAFQSAGVATPWHAQIATPQELQRAVIARGRDLVLKPAEQLGPATLRRLAGMDDSADIFQQVRAASPSGRVMAELAQDVVQLPAFLLAGTCHMAAEQNVRALVERAASALGISDGPVVAEIAKADGLPQIVELSPQLGAAGEFLDATVAWATGENVSPAQLAI
jgi:biotin carboxylase